MPYVQGYLLQLVAGKHWKPSPGPLEEEWQCTRWNTELLTNGDTVY